jgi:hypothetical protein
LLTASVALVLSACGQAAGSTDAPRTDATHTNTQPIACATADLTANVGEFGSVMSQPFLTIKLTNHSATPCQLRGYPLLLISGSFDESPTRPAHVDVRHGSTYERSDPGPHSVVIAPKRFASFTIGTTTALPAMAKFHRFEVRLDPEDDALVVKQEMPTSGRVGEPLSVLETALTLGLPRH